MGFTKKFKVIIFIFLLCCDVSFTRHIVSQRFRPKTRQIDASDAVKNTISVTKEFLTGCKDLFDWFKDSKETIAKFAGFFKTVEFLGKLSLVAGPFFSILSVFFEDENTTMLKEIVNSVNEINRKIDERHEQMKGYIKAIACSVHIDEVTNRLFDLKNEYWAHLTLYTNGFYRSREEFENTIKGSEIFDIKTKEVIDFLTKHTGESTAGTTAACSLIESIREGSLEYITKWAGSSVTLLQTKISYMMAIDVALIILRIKTSQSGNLIDQTSTFGLLNKAYHLFTSKFDSVLENLRRPEVFAKYASINLEKFWNEEKSRYSETERQRLADDILRVLAPHNFEWTLGVIVHSSYKPGNYYHTVRKNPRVQIIDSTLKNVIEVVYTANLLDSKLELEEYKKDYTCLDHAYTAIREFNTRSNNAETLITDEFFKKLNSHNACNNRLGGIILYWNGYWEDRVIAGRHNYRIETVKYASQTYKLSIPRVIPTEANICRWDSNLWCQMKGRLYADLLLNYREVRNWEAITWTSNNY